MPNQEKERRSYYVEVGHALGWSFTPLKGKRPYKRGWQTGERETLGEALAWAKQGNVGLRTGPISGVIVIDVDQDGSVETLNLPDTVTVTTGGGGRHYYFSSTLPIPNSAGKLAPHVDVRGTGGQVVYPGSLHPETDVFYEWEKSPEDIDVASLPESITRLLHARGRNRPAPAKRQTTSKPNTRYANVALQLEIKALLETPNGQRNDQLNRAAFSIGTLIPGGHMDEEHAVAELAAAALDVGLSQAETRSTITSGISAGKQQPRVVPDMTHHRPTYVQPPIPDTIDDDEKDKYVLVPGGFTDDVECYIERSNLDFARDIIKHFPLDMVYRRDNLPGEILGGQGKKYWIAFSENRMVLKIDEAVKPFKWVKRGDSVARKIYQPCNKTQAGYVIAEAQSSPYVWDLLSITNYPIYAPGFKILKRGYHDGFYYDEPLELENLEPQRNPEIIYNVLHDLIVDFPFRTESDRQNFFGLLITPIIAQAIDGNRPLHMLISPLERTGKTKLAEEVFGGVILGRQTPAMQLMDKDEERDKRVIGLLLQGETLLHFDNLPQKINSSALASLLTATTYSGRILGGNNVVNLQNNLTIVASGNNVQVTGEIAKRTIPIMLQPTSANPEMRSDFHHPDLREYVKTNREIVLSCLIGLIENWKQAGRPKSKCRLGGFENWSATIGGILQINGFTEWRKSETDWRRASNSFGDDMIRFVADWAVTFGEEVVAQADLREIAQRLEIFDDIFTGKTDRGIATAFGRMLRRALNLPVSKWYIRSHTSGSSTKWHLEYNRSKGGRPHTLSKEK